VYTVQIRIYEIRVSTGRNSISNKTHLELNATIPFLQF